MLAPMRVTGLALALCGSLVPAGCGESEKALPAASGACTLERPEPADWHLRADGTRLRDALGRVVFLRGVNMGGHSKLPPFSPFDYPPGGFDAALAPYVSRAAAWGIDAARVPFTWEAVEPNRGTDDAEFLARYDALLDALWRHGLYTIVDAHQDVYAQAFCGDGFPAWTLPSVPGPPRHDCENWGFAYTNDPGVQGAFDRFWAAGSPVQEGYAAMWDRMAARHADRPGVVAFEIMNEPGWGSADLRTFEPAVLTPFFTRLAARLRARAPSTLLLFEPTGLDGVTVETTLERPMGEGLVFAPHYYQIGVGNGGFVAEELRKWAALATRFGTPLLLGEFGVASDDSAGAIYMRAHFDALDTLQASGTEWEYSVTAEVWNAEHLSLVDAQGHELPAAAAIVRPYPRAVAGEPSAFAVDAQGVLSLRYAPAAGTTEIATPARAFPGGRSVTVEGGCHDDSDPERVLVRASPGAGEVVVRIAPR